MPVKAPGVATGFISKPTSDLIPSVANVPLTSSLYAGVVVFTPTSHVLVINIPLGFVIAQSVKELVILNKLLPEVNHM